MKAAHPQDGVVIEVVTIPPDIDLANLFPPQLGFIECPEQVAVGWRYDGVAFSPPPDPEPIDPALLLQRAKDIRKAAIDAAAERERLRYITPGTGQAMTYARKVEQARAALAATDPQPNNYPMLAASVGIDGPDIVAVATVVLAMDTAWEAIGAAIEKVRLAGKEAVDRATTAEAAGDVEVIWPEAVP